MKNVQCPRVNVRLSVEDDAALIALAQAKGCTRAEAARQAINLGLPLAHSGTAVNHRRYAVVLEFLAATMGAFIRRQMPDFEDEIQETMLERLEAHHAP